MTRRELLLLLGGTMAVPRAPRAQQKALPMIGFLASASPGPNASYIVAFGQGLSRTGWVERQNVAIEYRWAEAIRSAARIGRGLVSRNVDVIRPMAVAPRR
jgi:putative ABC transport system substrate-binding protein